ncbi:MAG TPA: serine/threonine-protein kinase [Thermoanaerobaculia bacterium]|nr:serine/threonine-protein kinase [Thermoanaerobaculia bacterium]
MNLAPGTTVGPYEILAPIGGGGMGEVYRARDKRLDREVAIKILLPELAARSEHLRRFEQEARAASSLNHPNIVTIYDVGIEGELAYIAMELIQGQDLRAMAAKAPVTLNQSVRIISKVADGLAAAHDRGIVHRDLKPENIIISTGGYVSNTGHVKILDFGLAKLVRPLSPNDPTLPHTHPGAVFGTVGYMSPEQASGLETDFRTDHFSLGVILFELLTGRRPFNEPTAAETMAAIIRDPVPPVSQLNPAVPPELERIVTRLLSKEPRDRYGSTIDLARDFREIRDMLTLSSGSRSTLPPLPAKGRRNVWAGVAVVAGLALLGGASWYALHPHDAAPRPAAPHVMSAASQAALAKAKGRLVQVRDERSVDGVIDNLHSLLKDERDSAPVNATLARALMAKYLFSHQHGYLEEASVYADRAVRLDPGLADAYDALGASQRLNGRYAEAAATFAKCIQLDPKAANSLAGLAQTYAAMGRAADAESTFERASTLAPDSTNIAMQYGGFCFTRGQYQKAADLFQRVTKILPDSARGHMNLGAALQALGRYDEAAAAYERSIALAPSGSAYSNLGVVRYDSGRYADACVALEKASALTPSDYRVWANLGDAYRWTPARKADAPQAYQRAIQSARAAISVNAKDALAHAVIGSCLAKSGQPGAADAEIRTALTIDPIDPYVLYSAAVVAELRGDGDAAANWLRRAVGNGYSSAEAAHDPELAALRNRAN